MKLALTGNPNSGKTTLFNEITGKVERVGNWPGVTVEKKEGPIKAKYNASGSDVIAVDLPGAYSMSPFTSEENVTRDFVLNESPDVIINIVDATNLSRSLFFTTQLLEIGVPVVVALNKSDLNQKKSITIDVARLSKELGCTVIETVSTSAKDNGLDKLISAAVSVKGQTQTAPFTTGDVDMSDKTAVENADKQRFEKVKAIVTAVENRKSKSNQATFQDSIDKVVAHKWLGIPIFAGVMWLVFTISQNIVGPYFADMFGAWIEAFYGLVEGMIPAGTSEVLSSILLDGIIGGVGAVVGFLPLIMVLFFLLALLEDCGYMARVATVMDRFLKGVGLSGKSIIPMVVGIGCAVPGVMATRTIENERQRRTTAMLTPFIPCGAKVPVILLISGAFFGGASWVTTLMYFIGIVVVILGAFITVRITGEKNAKSFFIMEMPEYKFPSIWKATVSMFSRAKAFIIKAATIILLCNAAVHIMQTFDMSFNVVAENAQHTSILATIAAPFAILMVPLGLGVWQLAAASITGFIAKENVVGTLAVVYAITNFIDVDALEIVGGESEIAATMGLTSIAALAFLMFNLYTPPCFAAIGAMNSEMENGKWLMGGIALQFGVAYVIAFFTYQFGTLFTTGALGVAFLPGLIAVVAMIAYVGYLVVKGEKKSAEKLMSAQKVKA